MKTRARRKSKDLQEQMAKMMEGNLEAAFKQFDTDASGSLDAEELTNAYKGRHASRRSQSCQVHENAGYQRRRSDRFR